MSSIRTGYRVKKSIEANKSAAESIGKIECGMHVFGVTRGQFSMIDAVQHCIGQLGACAISLWTWCIADYELETFESLLMHGDVTKATLVIDRAGEQQVAKSRAFRSGVIRKEDRQGALMRRWLEKFGTGSIKICLNHAKIATLFNGEYRVVIRGSMNLNHNPRFEQFDVTEGPDEYNLVQKIELGLPDLKENYTRKDVEHATGIHRAFNPEQLTVFAQNLKVWAK